MMGDVECSMARTLVDVWQCGDAGLRRCTLGSLFDLERGDEDRRGGDIFNARAAGAPRGRLFFCARDKVARCALQ